MNLDRCLDVGGVVSAPPHRDEPEHEWVAARDAGTIPPEVYGLYRATHYLSAGSVAGFDTEEQRLISTYFSRVMRSLLDCLDESANLVDDARDQISRLYTPLKRIRGEAWDKKAGREYRATFRLFLIDLVGALDALAELVALGLPGGVPGLRLGKCTFGTLLSWARKPLPRNVGIVTPVQHHAERLHEVLKQLVPAERPEEDWFELLRIYRNKVTHLGHQAWLQLGLQSKDDDEFYYFLPRTWPFIPERHMRIGDAPQQDNTQLKDYLFDSLMHVDVLTYSADAVRTVRGVVGAVVKILLEMYLQTNRIDARQLAPQLDGSSETCSFTGSRDAG
jgi:hypothetical protein